MASSSADGSLRLFDLIEARPVYDLRGHDSKAVNAVAFSPSGDYLASGGDDNLVFVWRTNIDDSDAAVRPVKERQKQQQVREYWMGL